VGDDRVENVIETIARNARTGVHGDGIMIVTPVEQGVNIMTIERGNNIIK
jgi:nitrogen regulatory protein P-II 1